MCIVSSHLLFRRQSKRIYRWAWIWPILWCKTIKEICAKNGWNPCSQADSFRRYQHRHYINWCDWQSIGCKRKAINKRINDLYKLIGIAVILIVNSQEFINNIFFFYHKSLAEFCEAFIVVPKLHIRKRKQYNRVFR